MTPLITVVVTAYGKPDEWVQLAVNSAQAANTEVLVVDNGFGQCAARQEGLDRAQGRFIRWLDGDDWLDHRHRFQFDFLISQDLEFCWGHAISHWKGQTSHLGDFTDPDQLVIPNRPNGWHQGAPQIGTALFRKDCLPAWRMDRQVMGQGAVEFFFHDCVSAGLKGAYFPQPVLHYRVNR